MTLNYFSCGKGSPKFERGSAPPTLLPNSPKLETKKLNFLFWIASQAREDEQRVGEADPLFPTSQNWKQLQSNCLGECLIFVKN
jgi:hypothetical protein